MSSSTTKFILWVDKELYALEKKSHLNGREKWELEGEGVAEYIAGDLRRRGRKAAEVT